MFWKTSKWTLKKYQNKNLRENIGTGLWYDIIFQVQSGLYLKITQTTLQLIQDMEFILQLRIKECHFE